MEFKTLVENRRSIRDYTPDVTIPQADLEAMIECSLQAPSWKNSQTARYYVASSPKVFEDVRAALPDFNQNSSKNASALVVTTFVKNISGFNSPTEATNECGDEWGAYDLGLANSYMLLKATELGYDSLIMGIRNSDSLRNVLNIPENEEIMAVIAIGKRNGEKRNQNRKTVSDVASFK